MNLYNEGLSLIAEVSSYRKSVNCGEINTVLPAFTDNEFVKIIVLYNVLQKLYSIIAIPIFSEDREKNKSRYGVVMEIKTKINIWLKNAYPIIKTPSTMDSIELIFNYAKYGYVEFLQQHINISLEEIKNNIAKKYITGGSKKDKNIIKFSSIYEYSLRENEFNTNDVYIRRYLNNKPEGNLVYNIDAFLNTKEDQNILPTIDEKIIEKYKTIRFENEHDYERVLISQEIEGTQFIELYNNTLNDMIMRKSKKCMRENAIKYINVASNLKSFVKYETLAYLGSIDELRSTLYETCYDFITNLLSKSNSTIYNFMELNLNNSIYTIYPVDRIISIFNEEMKNNNIVMPRKTKEDVDILVKILQNVITRGINTTVLSRPVFSIEQYLCYI